MLVQIPELTKHRRVFRRVARMLGHRLAVLMMREARPAGSFPHLPLAERSGLFLYVGIVDMIGGHRRQWHSFYEGHADF
ncbi:hypothetical protein [Bradyrhizobium sp. USDA 4452]